MGRRFLPILFLLVFFVQGCAGPPDLGRLFTKFNHSIARVLTSDDGGKTYEPDGTGFVYDGHTVITAKHCVFGEDFLKDTKFEVIVDGTTYPVLQVWYTSRDDRDIAILTVTEAFKVPWLRLARQDASIGSSAHIIGYPLNLGMTLSDGFVNGGPLTILGVPGCMEFSSPICPGNSGGPVMNDAGEVIGIVFAHRGTFSNLNFGSPVSHIKDALVEWQGSLK